MHARMVEQPSADWSAAVAGEIIDDQVQLTVRIGLVKGIQQLQIPLRIASWGRQSQFVPVLDPQCAIHPHFVAAARILKRRFDAMAVTRPARRRCKRAGTDWPKLIDTPHRAVQRGLCVERDDRRPFGAKSGSVLSAQE